MTVSVKMSSKNQIVVPKLAREALGLEPGDRLAVSIEDGTVRMEKMPPAVARRLRGALGGMASEARGAALWPELEEA